MGQVAFLDSMVRKATKEKKEVVLEGSKEVLEGSKETVDPSVLQVHKVHADQLESKERKESRSQLC